MYAHIIIENAEILALPYPLNYNMQFINRTIIDAIVMYFTLRD